MSSGDGRRHPVLRTHDVSPSDVLGALAILLVREDADDARHPFPPLPRRHLLNWFLGRRLPKKCIGKYVHYLIPEGQKGGARGRWCGEIDDTQGSVGDEALRTPQPFPGSRDVLLSDAGARARAEGRVGVASQTSERGASEEQPTGLVERTGDATRTQVSQVFDRLGAMDEQIGRRMSLLQEQTDRMEERVGRIEDVVGHVLQKLDAFAPSASSAPRW